MREVCESFEVELCEFNGERESRPPGSCTTRRRSPWSKLVNSLKGASAPVTCGRSTPAGSTTSGWGLSFWPPPPNSPVPAAGAPLTVIKQYIESQQRPHVTSRPTYRSDAVSLRDTVAKDSPSPPGLKAGGTRRRLGNGRTSFTSSSASTSSGIAALLGGFVTQLKAMGRGEARFVPAMLHGALTMLVTRRASLVGPEPGRRPAGEQHQDWREAGLPGGDPRPGLRQARRGSGSRRRFFGTVGALDRRQTSSSPCFDILPLLNEGDSNSDGLRFTGARTAGGRCHPSGTG